MPTTEQRLERIEAALGLRQRSRGFRLPAEIVPAGVGLGVDAAGLLVVDGVPQAAVAGLVAVLGSKADLVAGFVPTSQLGTGAGGGKFLRDDSTWVAGGGGGAHNLLSATHTDTLAAGVVPGDLLVGVAGAPPTWQRFPIGPGFLKGGAAPAWALIAQADVTNLVTDLAGKASTAHTHTEGDVTGLVDDLAAKEETANKGIAGGYASLDGSGDLPLTQLPAHGSTHEPGGSDAINLLKQTEVDFGAAPVADGIFVVVDADVSAGSKLIAQVAYEAPTGKDLDEVEMDDLQVRAGPGAGELTLFIRAADGSYLHDKFKINYLIG